MIKFMIGISGSARQRRLIVRRLKKRYTVRKAAAGLFLIGG